MSLPSVSFGEVREQNIHGSFLLVTVLHGQDLEMVSSWNSNQVEAALLLWEMFF